MATGWLCRSGHEPGSDCVYDRANVLHGEERIDDTNCSARRLAGDRSRERGLVRSGTARRAEVLRAAARRTGGGRTRAGRLRRRPGDARTHRLPRGAHRAPDAASPAECDRVADAHSGPRSLHGAWHRGLRHRRRALGRRHRGAGAGVAARRDPLHSPPPMHRCARAGSRAACRPAACSRAEPSA